MENTCGTYIPHLFLMIYHAGNTCSTNIWRPLKHVSMTSENLNDRSGKVIFFIANVLLLKYRIAECVHTLLS